MRAAEKIAQNPRAGLASHKNVMAKATTTGSPFPHPSG
jgi:hypothetical protein